MVALEVLIENLGPGRKQAYILAPWQTGCIGAGVEFPAFDSRVQYALLVEDGVQVFRQIGRVKQLEDKAIKDRKYQGGGPILLYLDADDEDFAVGDDPNREVLPTNQGGPCLIIDIRSSKPWPTP